MVLRLAKARVHFIGIGGIGMCGLAELLHNMGVFVKGSDLSENQQTLHLREIGIRVDIGHDESLLEGVDVAVYSSAVKSDNAEFVGAKKRGIPLIPRAEALAEIMRLRRGVAVGGSHGKTTTTSMAATVFLHSRMDPTIVVGGRLDLIQSTAKLGAGEWLIAEADESDGSFNRLAPEVAIVTNIDDDHLDHFGTIKHLEDAFFEFAMRVPFYGVAIVCGDDARVKRVFANFPKRIIFYGFESDNDFVVSGSNQSYSLHKGSKSSKSGMGAAGEAGGAGGEHLGDFKLQIPGRHNALNATAAILAGHVAGLSFDRMMKGIESYEGVDRRFQKKGEAGGITFYDDYGHHPTEVRAVISAFKDKYPDSRLVVLFQPHRHSRTEQCWKDFLTCFEGADLVRVLDIYGAGEKPIKGIDAKALVAEIKHDNCSYIEDKAGAGAKLISELKPGDIFVTLGAGDVWKIGEELLRAKGRF